MWATVPLCRQGNRFQRIIQILEVRYIQTGFEMVQAQIRNLRLQDEQIKGLSEEVIWAVGHASLDGAPMQTDTFQSQSLSRHGLCHERNYVPLRHSEQNPSTSHFMVAKL